MWQAHSFQVLVFGERLPNQQLRPVLIKSLNSPKVVAHICVVSCVFTLDVLTDLTPNFLLAS